MKTLSVTLLALALVALSHLAIFAQEVTKETIVEGLNNPCGVAIQPGTDHIFIADSGALRIVRIVDGDIQEVITGFPKDTFGPGSDYEIGPLGMTFVDKDTLVVGGGGLADGEEMLRAYKIPPPGTDPLSADKMDESFTLKAEAATVGEGDFFGLAASKKAVYVTCNGDDTKGWIAKADLAGNKLSKFRRFIASKELSGTHAPSGITISPEGYIVVGQMGKTESQSDSLLAFYNEEGKFLDKFPTGLNDITSLAYGPKRKRLFATDFNFSSPSKGGLFKLIETKEDAGCRAVKITELDKPTSMVFDKNGDLYVTVFGTPMTDEERKEEAKTEDQPDAEKEAEQSDENAENPAQETEESEEKTEPKSPGKLIKIVGLDNPPKGS